MKRAHFIALDTHCQFTEFAVIAPSGQVIKRDRQPTTIPHLVEVVQAVSRPRIVVVEEGPLADWLWRNLARHADDVVVCDPHRNRLIAQDSDKDDDIDAEKLGQLLRGGYLKRVHHPESFARVIFKQQVGLYHDSVRQRVRAANRILSLLRQHGIFVSERSFATVEQREELVRRLSCGELERDFELLWRRYDVLAKEERERRKRLTARARQEEVLRRWVAVPGFKWVRAATLFVYLDTPCRFASKTALWKYVGLGLERRHSGSGPLRMRLSSRANRCLKNVLLGAAKTAIRVQDSPFAQQYRRWLHEGYSPGIATRNVARRLVALLWGMWKNGSVYHPEWVGIPAAEIRG